MNLSTRVVAAGADPFTGIGHMLSQGFMVRALLAGGVVAAACGLVGYFLVLRAQVFAGDALSHVAFTGAMAALAAGVDLRLGLFVACVGFGLAVASMDRRGSPDDVAIGNVFAWVLGLGALFLTVYTTHSSNGRTGVGVLFGSVFGLSGSQATVCSVIGLGAVVATGLIARPLLFASVDGEAALAAGVPVRFVGLILMIVVGITAGEATQVVGSLLVLGLLAGPAATAHLLARDPWRGMALAGATAVLSMWFGLSMAYAFPRLPASFCVLALSTAAYLGAAVWRGSARVRTAALR